jgi:hypothetical protein
MISSFLTLYMGLCAGIQITSKSLNHWHSGGRGGIRTHGTLAGTPVFKTGALNHSATLPAVENVGLFSHLPEQSKSLDLFATALSPNVVGALVYGCLHDPVNHSRGAFLHFRRSALQFFNWPGRTR